MPQRKTDWALVLTVCTLIAFIYTAFSKGYAWDGAVADIKEMKPQIADLKIQMAVLVDRANSINQHVSSIDRKTQ